MNLEGKVALVTGAAQGIGKSIALALAKQGATVVISDVNLEKADAVAGEIRGTGRKALAVACNVGSADEVNALFDRVVQEYGQVDVVVNNAGITRDGLLMRLKDEEWDQVININLKGVFLCCRAAIKLMAKKRSGRVINIASIVGAMGNAGQINYSASKAGVIGMTKTIAKEYAGRNITCNAVAPGFIDTAMTQALPEDVKNLMLSQIPLSRFGSADDVANAVLFLASDEAGYITGQVLHVNGGMYM
ncbi:MAG: 3-oxoacyl-[acyl-carrier-protein] reductase [Nitrospirota bacterium]|nr:3-oxoacyl-[acyl-carrier-protein] reductase [Nitrospirota bacterium]